MSVYFDLTPRHLPFTIESLGVNWNQLPVQRPDGYPDYHWLQTQSGQGEIFVGDHRYLLKKNAGILIAPFTPHTYAAIGETPWVTAFTTIGGIFADRIGVWLQGNNVIYIEDASDLLQWQLTLVHDFEHHQISSQGLALEAYHFLLKISEHLDYPDHSEHKLFEQYMRPTIVFIEAHYAEDLSVESLAENIFVTPQYLTRLFQRFFDMSVSVYLSRFRIKKSKELLVTKKETEIQVISQLAGFKSSSHFIATFKKFTGQTPAAFRKLYNN